MGSAGWALVGAYAGLSAVRIGLSVRNWRRADAPADRHPRPSGPCGTGPITVLQPIRSGDPALGPVLAENLANHPGSRFIWLVDTDDAEARRVCDRLAAGHSGVVEVMLCEPCPPRTNPKVFKLALGLPHCTELVAVLDDDTVLPPGALDRARAALDDADLSTGLPWYRTTGEPWTDLVAGFVNGNALVSYFPLLGFGPPVTINGMFYLTSRTSLARAGGFEAILDRVCDDYELARAFRAAGLRLAQTTVTHPVSTEVPDAAGYVRLMHRWMVFTGRLLTSSATVPMTLLVVLPAVLPPIALAVSLATGSLGAAAGIGLAVAAKVFGTQAARRALTPQVPRRFVAEYLADWLLPVQSAIGLALPRRIVWRGRRLRVVRGRLT